MRSHPLSTKSLLIALTAAPAWASQQATCPSQAAAGCQKEVTAVTSPTLSAPLCQTEGASTTGTPLTTLTLAQGGKVQLQPATAGGLNFVIHGADGELLTTENLNLEGLDHLVLMDASAGCTAVATEAASGERGYMGVTIEIGDGALTIQSVFPGGPAEKAGLQAGDRIVRIADQAIDSEETVATHLQSKHVGEEVAIRVDRDGWTRDMTLTLSAPDAAWNLGGMQAQEVEGFEVMETEPQDFSGTVSPQWTIAGPTGIEVLKPADDAGDPHLLVAPSQGECQAKEPNSKWQEFTIVLGQGAQALGSQPQRMRLQGQDGSEYLLDIRTDGACADGNAARFQMTTPDGACQAKVLDCPKVLSKSIEIPGGQCQVEVRIEGDCDVEEILKDCNVGKWVTDLDLKNFKFEGKSVGEWQLAEPHIMAYVMGSDDSAGCCAEQQSTCQKSCQSAAQDCAKACAELAAQCQKACAEGKEAACQKQCQSSCDAAAKKCEQACEKAAKECEQACEAAKAECSGDASSSEACAGSDGVVVIRRNSGETPHHDIRILRSNGERGIVVHGGEAGESIQVVAPEVEIRDIARQVELELAEPKASGQPNIVRRRVRVDGERLPMAEMRATRSDFGELRSLREELAELQSLRQELKALLKELEAKGK